MGRVGTKRDLPTLQLKMKKLNKTKAIEKKGKKEERESRNN